MPDRLLRSSGFILLLILLSCAGAHGQEWGFVEGTVTGTDGVPLPDVTVLIKDTNFGTAADKRGHYQLRAPVGTWTLQFSSVGFETRLDTVRIQAEEHITLDVTLPMSTTQGAAVLIEDTRIQPGAVRIDPEVIQNVPGPFRDGFRVLKIMPGVATNNELSSEYSVRGGGFNENLIFVNGFEVYKPFRVRQGEQEGLGLINPDLVRRMTFYTGGFPARYGGKLSSALDVVYAPKTDGVLSGSAYLSLLDAGTMVSAGSTGGLRASVGVRKARAQHLFDKQELEGRYDPDYTDVQAVVDAPLGRGHTLKAVGIFAKHQFRLEPSTQRTYFGTFNNLQSIWFDYNGNEEDGFDTGFAGIRLSSPISPNLRVEHGAAIFSTRETETFDISGSAVLYLVGNPADVDPETGEGLIPTGSARQEDFADNEIRAENLTFQQRWLVNISGRTLDAGWFLRDVSFEDKLNEKSIVVGRNTDGDVVRVIADSLRDEASFDATQAGGYLEYTFGVGRGNRLTVTSGLRSDYLSFNEELTLSPRLAFVYQARPGLTFTGSWGIYHQAPGYREFRGRVRRSGELPQSLNNNLKSQRAVQYIAGTEYFLPGSRLFLHAELYYKDLDRLISYDVENVRLTYSGENDSQGYAYGIDLQLRGEFVPGLESWLNYGFLFTREEFADEFTTDFNRGLRPRPTDQRHTISLFLQDYVPNEPSVKLHLRLLYGTGLPYTPPIPGPQVGNIQAQVPGPRNSDRFPAYQRVDMGATKTLELAPKSIGSSPVSLELTAEVLNVFDMTNTVAYTWVARADGIWNRIPTRLTPRTFNLRARLVF